MENLKKRGMNRFPALNCLSRAEPLAPALNRWLPRFLEKMAKFLKNKLNNSFSIFGFLRGTNRFVPHWFICLFSKINVTIRVSSVLKKTFLFCFY